MPAAKNDIIAQLQKEILSLQGLKPLSPDDTIEMGLREIDAAFPNSTFPIGAVHEFISTGPEDAAASGGFMAGLLASLMRKGGACIWINAGNNVFPSALKTFGVDPDRVIFVNLRCEKDVLWVMEESLKCEGLAAVVGEMQEIGFTNSRRLQLAVEHSRVTGFILRHRPRNLNAVACVARWKISSLPSKLPDALPGVGFPRWQVELLKIRNGRPGRWQMEWSAGRFHAVIQVAPTRSRPHATEEQRKTG